MHAAALFDIFLANHKGEDTGSPNSAVRTDFAVFVPQIRTTYVAAPPRPLALEPIMRRIRSYGVNLVVGDVRLHVRTLPPKTTAELQPCDQGLISWLKHGWRGEVDRRLVAATSDEEIGKLSQTITALDVMPFISNSLRSIQPATGMRYWRPLLDPTSRTYADVIHDSTTLAEGILVSEDKALWE
jgi:hypothetical protein